MEISKLFSVKKIISYFVVFFVCATLGYVITPKPNTNLVNPGVSGGTETQKTTGFGKYADEPKTEACPLNGVLYSKSEKTLWEAQRPILAMIENHVDARPQSGLSKADIIYEAVAEGGITRFMGVFYCGAQADQGNVAPVRSARMYFVNLAAEYNTPIYMHVGGGNCGRDEASGQCVSNKKAWALEELMKLGWRKAGGNDFDTTSDTGYPVLIRDYNRLGANVQLATEHTMVGSLAAAWKQADKRGYSSTMPDGKTWLSGFTPWKISATSEIKGTPASDVKFDFWPGYKDFSVEWVYDATSSLYKRNMAGAPHIDLDTKQQLTAANVVIQFVKEENLNDIGKHMFYDVISEGTGLIFQKGQAMEIKWKKAKQTARTIFTDKLGKEISFVPGVTWIELVPSTTKAQYQ